jgi:UDP-galactopyranose mutase
LRLQSRLLRQLIRDWDIQLDVLWYYTPQALAFSADLKPRLTVYDCMDELSAFAGAPRELAVLEDELFRRADLVFTGGQSLYEHKRPRHPRVHLFPSSVDCAHFGQALELPEEPADQTGIPRPRLGFFGVVDERMDFELVTGLADARPEWQIVMVGPVAKIDAAKLPSRPNLHWLGPRQYAELPAYLSGWDVALLPFARNEATRFISPTKTPEYLAAGRPVVSTPVRDVERPYGQLGLVQIGDTVETFAAAVERALNQDLSEHRARAQRFLAQTSWESTWESMRSLIEAHRESRPQTAPTKVATVQEVA